MPQDQLVALQHQKAGDRAEKDPAAVMNQLMRRIAVQVPAVRDPRQHDPGQAGACGRGNQVAGDQRPDRLRDPGEQQHDDHADDLRADFQDRHSAQRHVTRGGLGPRGFQRQDQQAGRGDGHHLEQQRLMVEPGHRPGQRAGDGEEHHRADHVQRPGGVQEIGVVAPFGRLDRGLDAQVRQHRQADQQDRDQGHGAERLGEQQPRQDQVRTEADRLLRAKPGDGEHRRAHDASGQSGSLRLGLCGHGNIGQNGLLRLRESPVGSDWLGYRQICMVNTAPVWRRKRLANVMPAS